MCLTRRQKSQLHNLQMLFVSVPNLSSDGKYDSRPISYSSNARIIISHIIWRWNNAGIENSCIVPKMRESGTLRTKIGARIGSFSCQDNKKKFSTKRAKILNLFIKILIIIFYQILLMIYYSKEYLKSF